MSQFLQVQCSGHLQLLSTTTMTSSASQNPVRIAILDDYQQVAFTFADWSSVKDSATVDVFTDNIADEDLLVKRLEPYTIISTMRERTKFTASLLDRLPNLRYAHTTHIKCAISRD